MRSSPTPLLALLLTMGGAAAMRAQAPAADTTTVVRIHGFLDAYYAYDATRPADGDRRFVTQPARHDEFNINLPRSAWPSLGRTHARR
ncbi:MAG: porin [Gemmatimonadaceae bacterium]|nr:porin [Gemmatimonadaceae bacterium]